MDRRDAFGVIYRNAVHCIYLPRAVKVKVNVKVSCAEGAAYARGGVAVSRRGGAAGVRGGGGSPPLWRETPHAPGDGMLWNAKENERERSG